MHRMNRNRRGAESMHDGLVREMADANTERENAAHDAHEPTCADCELSTFYFLKIHGACRPVMREG